MMPQKMKCSRCKRVCYGMLFVLGMLSGWDTYTRLAFPSCNFDATPIKVQLSKKKRSFMDQRRFFLEDTNFD